MKRNSRLYLWPFGLPKSICILLFAMLLLRLFFAWQWPMLNDETYYWDWARALQLSYVDAPPAVAWTAFVGSHFLSGSLGARLLVPFLNFFAAIFLIKSADVLFHAQNKALTFDAKLRHDIRRGVVVIALFFCVFYFQGILLLPDAPLFFAGSGALYYALKSCEKYVRTQKQDNLKKEQRLSLKNACFLGFFIGLGIVSKYQGVPLALGLFFAIVCLRGIKNTIQKDFLFWMITILIAFFVSSPLFIWNLQNNFASFKFQGQHGFSSWHFDLKQFLIYTFSTIGVVLPWYFYLFFKQVFSSLKKRHVFSSLEMIPLFSFFAIFIFIGSAALGKHAELHWITPAFLFLIPLVAVHWEALTARHSQFWKNITIITGVIITIVCAFIFTKRVQDFLAQDKRVFGLNIKNVHNGLYNGLIWGNLHDPEQNFFNNVPQIQQAEKPYFSNLTDVKCKYEPYFATFNWRWAGQFAFYLKNNPRVLSFNFSRSTYYTWRDSLPALAGCRIFIVGPKGLYNKQELERVLSIESIKEFTIQKSYTLDNLDMIFVDGVMKDKKTLEEIKNNLLQNARF